MGGLETRPSNLFKVPGIEMSRLEPGWGLVASRAIMEPLKFKIQTAAAHHKVPAPWAQGEAEHGPSITKVQHLK